MDVSPEFTPSAPAREVDEDGESDVTGRDICDPAHHDWCPSPSQLPMPNFLSWYFEGREIPTEDAHVPDGCPIDFNTYSPISCADGPSPAKPAAEDSAPASPSAQSDASIPPLPDLLVPVSASTVDAP